MNNRNNSLFELIYNKANKVEDECLDIEDTIDVSFLDVIKRKTVKVLVKQQEPCMCLKDEYASSFYCDCDKCNNSGVLVLGNIKVLCNRCKGKGKILKDLCPLCSSRLYVLNKKEMNITLSGESDIVVEAKGLKSNDNIGNLLLHVNVIDKDEYIIKGNDVYSKKIIFFKKNEFDRTKEVETCIDFTKFKLSEVKYENVIKFSKKGLNGGDFYQPVRCEVKGDKGKDVYKNVILDTKKKGFYISREEIYSSSCVINAYDFKPLNDDNYDYIELSSCNSYTTVKVDNKGLKGKDNGDNGDLYIQIFVGRFFVKNNDIFLSSCDLNKSEMSGNKKVITVNGTKISVPFDKKQSNNYFLDMGNYGLIENKDKKSKLYIRIPVVDKETYNITVNAKEGYIKDYKKFFGENVKVYKTNNNLEDYIYFNGEGIVRDTHGNDIVISLKKGVK